MIGILQKKVPPQQDHEEIVRTIILNTSALALEKDRYVEFAPITGTCGNVKLSGNSLPIFSYTVFEKKIMEFIQVTVEISKPETIAFSSKIKSEDPNFDGKKVPTIEKYKRPFFKLATQLVQYFPFPPFTSGAKKNVSKTEGEAVQVQNDSTGPDAVHRTDSDNQQRKDSDPFSSGKPIQTDFL